MTRSGRFVKKVKHELKRAFDDAGFTVADWKIKDSDHFDVLATSKTGDLHAFRIRTSLNQLEPRGMGFEFATHEECAEAILGAKALHAKPGWGLVFDRRAKGKGLLIALGDLSPLQRQYVGRPLVYVTAKPDGSSVVDPWIFQRLY